MPSYPALSKLSLSSCSRLASLATQDKLAELKLSRCPIASLPPLPSLCELTMQHLTMRYVLPQLPRLKTLTMLHCGVLKPISHQPELVSLSVENCHNITAIAHLPALTSLRIVNCSCLSVVEGLPRLAELNTRGIPATARLPQV